MTMQTELIDTTSRLQSFLDGLVDDTSQPPILYVDLEGNNLSRYSTLSLIIIFVKFKNKVYFINITTLQHDVFDTAGSNGRIVRAVLESDDIIKVFFDIRNDSNALFGIYGVYVARIEDLQLIELTLRTFDKRRVNSLAKCIKKDSTIGFKEKQAQKVLRFGGRFPQAGLPRLIHTVLFAAEAPHVR